MGKLRTCLFVPNLITFFRISLSLYASTVSSSNPWYFIAVVLLACVTDIVDGYFARKLNQCSKIGVFLDVVADNILRTVLWVAAALARPKLATVAAAIISLEWICFVSTQLSTLTNKEQTWKSRKKLPWIVSKYFENGFRNLFGGPGVIALFFCPLFIYMEATVDFGGFESYAQIAGALCCAYRVFDSVIEIYFILDYVNVLLELDEENVLKKR